MLDNEPKVGPDGEPIEEQGTSIEKFKSAQDRDKAYLELEKKTRLDSQRLADLEAKLEQVAAMNVSSQVERQEPQDQRSFSDEYKSQEQLKQFWSRFASKPDEVFREREEQMMGRVMQVIETRTAVENFKSKNPDLAKHEDLVAIFVKKQPVNLSPAERLKKAAPEARKYLAELARSGATSKEDTLDTDAYVESPSGARESSAPVVKDDPAEDSLAEAIKAHSAARMKSMNPKK